MAHFQSVYRVEWELTWVATMEMPRRARSRMQRSFAMAVSTRQKRERGGSSCLGSVVCGLVPRAK